MYQSITLTFILMLLTNLTYASNGYDKTFQNEKTKMVFQEINCISRKQGIDVFTEINNKLTTFKISLNMALHLQLMDEQTTLKKHCTEGTIKNLNQFLNELDIQNNFRNISKSIGIIFPIIDLEALANRTFICKSNKRLERLLAPGIEFSKKRKFVWKKRENESFDGIFYESPPVVKNKTEEEQLIWAFVKELLHNHINMDNEFYARDGDLQRSVRTIKEHISDGKGTIDDLIKTNASIGFPY